jgi:hypothetical protein
MGLRTVRESQSVAGMFDYLYRKSPRFEQLWEGWSWRLARNPFIDATPIPGTNPQEYLLRTPQLQVYGMPHSLTLRYTVSDDLVDLIAVRLIGPAP